MTGSGSLSLASGSRHGQRRTATVPVLVERLNDTRRAHQRREYRPSGPELLSRKGAEWRAVLRPSNDIRLGHATTKPCAFNDHLSLLLPPTANVGFGSKADTPLMSGMGGKRTLEL